MVLWYLQALLGNGAHCSMLSRETREMWKNRWSFFKLSLVGFKVWAQSNCSDRSAMEQDCSWAGMLQIFPFCQNQSFPWERTEFLSIFFFFYWNCQMNFFDFGFGWTIYCTATLLLRFQSQPLLSHRTKALVPVIRPCLCSLSRPHEQPMIPTPVPFVEGACWRRSRCSSLDQNRASTPGELLDPALPWGRRLWQRATSQNAQQDFFFFFLPKVLHVPLQVWAGPKKNLGLGVESGGWFEAHSLENDN